MLTLVQFPIADLRAFSSRGANRLAKPEWPPNTGVGIPKSFVRAFGAAEPRRKGADNAYMDERSFCGAQNALKFAQLHESPTAWKAPVRCAFRRLLFDGKCVGRVEVGITTPHGDDGGSIDLAVSELDKILRVLTVVPFNSSSGKKRSNYRPKELILQGYDLARHFARSTTASPGPGDENVQYDLVVPCNPLVVLELDALSLPSLPGHFVRVDSSRVGGIDLAFGRINLLGGDLGVWLIANSVLAEANHLRSLRLCLSRLHSEQEVLQATLAKLDSGQLDYQAHTDQGDALEKYLRRAIKSVDATTWGGIEQTAIRDVFTATDATPSNWRRREHLRERLQGAREQIIRKAERHERQLQAQHVVQYYGEVIHVDNRQITIGDGNTITAPIVIADKIENSFNLLRDSETDSELKATVELLLQQIAELGAAIPSEKAVEMASDAETLSKEITRPKPRRKWYELSIEGIKEAAEAVGEMGKPILETTVKLLPLLAALFP